MEKFMDNKSWDGLDADYDKSVEDNKNNLIVNYHKKEIYSQYYSHLSTGAYYRYRCH